MKEKIITIAIGVIIGGSVLGYFYWLTSTTIETRNGNASVVQFLNNQIQASKSAPATSSPVK